MSEPKQVKVDNWGIYFLQRLKHFFNRTDYCDLTLQFQDNAQLKVHRLVLSACTEYFELLERTCEMYEDCLVMPDDLQADVVVPIVNFMYTGQLEFKMDILDRLHACSEIMNMPVLSKLLDSHRPKNRVIQNYSKRQAKPQNVHSKSTPPLEVPLINSAASKRSYTKAFESSNVVYRDKKQHQVVNKTPAVSMANGGVSFRSPSPIPLEALCKVKTQKFVVGEPRPTRYELPEELDTDNLFENSFCNISYTSQPLMVHPETSKQYAKRPRFDKGQPSTSKRLRSATLDIVECKQIEREPEENLFEESVSSVVSDEGEMFKPFINEVKIKMEPVKDPNKLFDQLLDQNQEHSAKVTIETTKNNKAGANLDHAKIISEVLKKYPHLVKSNKNIKLKIFNKPTVNKTTAKKQKPSPQRDESYKIKVDSFSDYTYETDVLDSKHAAKLIALGAENIEGPWICLICGTPGKALHFTSYFKFRRHLVEVHNEKPVLNICEYCGQKMTKRNHLLHHMYTKHGVEPPPSYSFPKCTQCSYIALTEALLVKHKLTHSENKSFRCNVCPSSFNSSNQLLNHIQNTGHKCIADRKQNHHCMYCLRVFIRENNLYAHLKTHHKVDAVKDGIIDESDDEAKEILHVVKREPTQHEFDDNNMEYHIQQKPDGNIQLIKKKPAEAITPSKQKILNSGLTSETPKAPPSKPKAIRPVHSIPADHEENVLSFGGEKNTTEIVVVDNVEYIMNGNRLILRRPPKISSEEYILTDMGPDTPETSSQSETPSTSMDYTTILNSDQNIQQASIILKDAGDLAETIPIYVSNEEEYNTLMTSDHNIIFDSSDANKTLTVLTTPDTAHTLENAAIDLDNSQNNDMMIIQDEYALNVSEAVASNNSNIVVVYSHQMSEPNKGYQLLTTQAIGPQYAQTSAILTHNYETVSTTSPVMSSNILDPSVATWQGDIHHNLNNQNSNANAIIESIVHTDEVQDTNAAESINDLPQAQLIPDASTTTNINQSEDIGNLPPESLQETTESELIPNTQDMSIEINTPEVTIMEEIENNDSVVSVSENVENASISNEAEGAKQIESQEIEHDPASENLLVVEDLQEVMSMGEQSSNINENISKNVHSINEISDTNENAIGNSGQSLDATTNSESMPVQTSDADVNVISMPVQILNTDVNVISMPVQNSGTNEEVLSMGVQSSLNNISMDVQSSNTNENLHEPVAVIATAVNAESNCNENALCATEVVEQIQTLTSEWSEDDVETPSQDTAEDVNNPESKSGQVEESIENIQQELQKQTMNQIPEDEEMPDCLASPQDEIPASEEDKSETNQTIDPQVKISSLLNDWDDNDSQEDNEMDESVTIEPNIPNSDEVSTDVIPVTEKVITESDSLESAVGQETPTAVPEDTEIIENTPTDPKDNEPEASKKNETVEKHDKIQSLVSDWSDEEEEIKE